MILDYTVNKGLSPLDLIISKSADSYYHNLETVSILLRNDIVRYYNLDNKFYPEMSFIQQWMVVASFNPLLRNSRIQEFNSVRLGQIKNSGYYISHYIGDYNDVSFIKINVQKKIIRSIRSYNIPKKKLVVHDMDTNTVKENYVFCPVPFYIKNDLDTI